MLAQGGVATSICNCSISVITWSPSCFCACERNFLSTRRTAWRVFASNRKYSSSMPSVYMRATTAPNGTLFHCRLTQKRPPQKSPRRPLIGRETTDGSPSAARLAAAGGVDLFLQRIEADRADHDVVADHITRRAIEAEGLGELEAFLQRGLDLRACQILVQAPHVEADVLGNRERTGLVRLTAPAQQLLVEFKVFLAALVLHVHGDRHLRRFHRAGSQDRKFLQHDLELGIVFHQREHVIHCALAVAAVVVKEFHERDIAVRIAEYNLTRRGEEGF